MPRWFGRRGREEKGAAATDALLGAAQERGIPTMRVDDPDEVAISLGVAAYQKGDLARAEEIFRTVAGSGRRSAAKVAYYLDELLQGRGDPASAERAYRQAAEGDDREIAAVAMACWPCRAATTRPRRPSAGRSTRAIPTTPPVP